MPIDTLNSFKNPITMILYHVMSITVIIALGVFAVGRYWGSVFNTISIILLMLVPFILVKFYKIYIPYGIRFGIALLGFLTLFLGEILSFYDTLPLWDKVMHVQSGLLFAACGYVLLYVLNDHSGEKLNLSPSFIIIFLIAFSLAIGVAWEIFEFAADSYLGSMWQASNTDTMWDLICDTSGAVVASAIGYFWMSWRKRLPFTPWRV